DLVLASQEHLEFSPLYGLIRVRTAAGPAGSDFFDHLVISEARERRLNGRKDAAQACKIISALNVLNCLPHPVNGLDQVVIAVREGDDTQYLRKVRVARCTHEQSVWFAADFSGKRTEPWA